MSSSCLLNERIQIFSPNVIDFDLAIHQSESGVLKST